ncbi:MAG: helix-turn-helix domain-containing protein [Lactococcus hircilactis]
MLKNDEKKVAVLKDIRTELKSKRITTIELAKQLNMDSAYLSDYLFFRKLPSDQLISDIRKAIEEIEQAAQKKVEEAPMSKEALEIIEKERVVKEKDNETSFEFSEAPLKLGDKIKRVREKIGYSQAEFALLLKPEVSPETVKYWENNFGVPLLDYCIQISDLGVVTLDWLLKD